MTEQTHGPWTGLDFDPVADLNRTRALCPLGWLLLGWSPAEDDESARLIPYEAYGIPLGASDLIAEALDVANLGPIDFGLEDWPEHRLFIGRLSIENSSTDGAVWDVELLRGPDGQPAHADLLPEGCGACRGSGVSGPELYPCPTCQSTPPWADGEDLPA